MIPDTQRRLQAAYDNLTSLMVYNLPNIISMCETKCDVLLCECVYAAYQYV